MNCQSRFAMYAAVLVVFRSKFHASRKSFFLGGGGGGGGLAVKHCNKEFNILSDLYWHDRGIILSTELMNVDSSICTKLGALDRFN